MGLGARGSEEQEGRRAGAKAAWSSGMGKDSVHVSSSCRRSSGVCRLVATVFPVSPPVPATYLCN